ncbi:unnamed protein product [Prunus armeniaca]
MAKCMIHDKELPYTLWCEPVNTSVYLLNRSPTRALENTTPFKNFSGRKPGVKHFKVFGLVCHSLIPGKLRHKLEATSAIGVFIGYGTCENGYRILNLATQKVFFSRDVVFDEHGKWDWEQHKVKEICIPLPADEMSDMRTTESEEEPAFQELEIEEEPADDPSIDDTPLRYRNLSEIYASCHSCIVEPENFDEAAQDEAWKKAMENEMNMIEKNQTWELVNRPFNKPIIGVKWVYKNKLNLDGSVQKHKARLVAKGYAQKPGIDYNETSAPVARCEISFSEWSASRGGEQLDDFIVQGEENKVYKLHKVLYGLKQAPRAWYGEIDSYLVQCGFKRSTSEATLYVKGRGTSDLDCKSVGIPVVPADKLKRDSESGAANEAEYRKLVGSLLYLTATRPDIMYVVCLLGRFMHSPTNKHYGIAKRILSDWFGLEDDMNSTSGYAFTFGRGVFSWAYVKQQCVAISTAEAEYVRASEATAQATWLRFVLEDFGEMQTVATPLNCDNTSAIAIPKNLIFHQKTKHINRRYHNIKEALQQGVINLIHCPKMEQVADIFTKTLAREQFAYLRESLGVKSVHNLKGSVNVQNGKLI